MPSTTFRRRGRARRGRPRPGRASAMPGSSQGAQAEPGFGGAEHPECLLSRILLDGSPKCGLFPWDLDLDLVAESRARTESKLVTAPEPTRVVPGRRTPGRQQSHRVIG